MNQPPNSGMNTPPGYGQTPPGYGPPPNAGPVPHSGSYQPPPQSHHGMRGMTRQMFNPATYRQPGSGSWAAASLIISLVSMFLCLGLLAPLSLIFGLLGLVGNKRAKGMSFVAVILSVLQIGFWVMVMGTGMYVQFQQDTMAEQGGMPVVAAIEEFKNNEKRVPHSLEELVANGYLPPTWEQGFDGIDGHVEEVVKGKKWSEFLAYKAGGNPDWKGTPDSRKTSDVSIEGDWDNWSINFDDKNKEPQAKQTYGLTFVGIDGVWSTSDDHAVNQSPEEPYELTNIRSGSSQALEFAKKRRELQKLQKQLASKVEEYEIAATNGAKKVEETDLELRELIKREGLDSFEMVQANNRGAGLLKLIGKQQKVVLLAQKKLKNSKDKLDNIDIQVRLLATEEDMAKLADNPEELAELITLLEETEKVLNTGGDLDDLDKLDEDKAAQDWFKNNFK